MNHFWGDSWTHWEDLEKAETYIHNEVYRKTRCYLISKEKYGSIRYQYIVPPKGHACMRKYAVYAPWTRHTRHGSYQPLLFCWNESWLYDKWQAWGWRQTRNAVYRAVLKWPHLKDELLSDLAAHEKLVGSEIHNHYWTTATSTPKQKRKAKQ